MAAGVFGANLSINAASGSKSINTILGGTNTYERVVITVTKTGVKDGVVHVGGSNVSASVFGYVLKTGDTWDIPASTTVNMGANLFVFNPSTENVRVEVVGFATA